MGIHAIVLAAGWAAAASAPVPPGHGVSLSPAQRQRVVQAIAGLGSPAERRVAEAWSPAKQAAEVLCRPLALQVLRARAPAVDKVFLGLGGGHDLNLRSDRLLTGQGQARHGNDWETFAFACELDPASGRAVRFVAHRAEKSSAGSTRRP